VATLGFRSAARQEPARLPLRRRAEGLGAAIAFGFFRILPIDCASAVGAALGRAIGPRLAVSRRARHNLRNAFPALSEVEIERIVGGMCDNLGRVAAEYPHLRRIRVFEPGGRVVRWPPRRSAATDRLAATAPFGISSPPPPRKRRIILSTSGLLAARWIRDRPEQWFWLHRRWPD
jgi:lauroyl/myristoyl acyltransferase